MTDAAYYRKANSFVAIRQRQKPRDVGERIARCRERLPHLTMSDRMRQVLQQACDELGGTTIVPEADRFVLHANVVEEIGRLTDEELPRYLFSRYRYDVYPQRRILDDFPPCLQIEPASICNYRCVFCYQTDATFTKKASGQMGLMSLDTFKRVIDQAEGQCEAVTLASRGEPLICRDIAAMVRYAGGKFLAFKINTNAWYLDEAKSHAIVEAGVNTVVFSADAATEPTYSQLRVNGNLARVTENIRRFKDIRDRHYPDSRTITRVSGVNLPGTGDLDEMERFWGELVDQVAFVTYQPWENTYERPVGNLTTPCSDLWRRMFVWWDGTVNPCDVDYKSTLAVGSVATESLAALWRGRSYQALRDAHGNGARVSCEPCSRCTVV